MRNAGEMRNHKLWIYNDMNLAVCGKGRFRDNPPILKSDWSQVDCKDCLAKRRRESK